MAYSLLVGLIFAAPTLRAQSTLCFRGQPLPKCEAFVLFELTGMKRLVGTTQLVRYPYSQTYVEDLGDYLSLRLGAMSNLDSAHAVGGVMDFGYGDGWRVAIKARRRTWNPGGSSLDLSVGGIGVQDRRRPPGTPVTNYGITTDAALGDHDLMAVTLGADVLWPPTRTRPRAALHGGLRLGSYFAMAGAGLLIAGVAVIAWGLSHSDF